MIQIHETSIMIIETSLQVAQIFHDDQKWRLHFFFEVVKEFPKLSPLEMVHMTICYHVLNEIM